MSGIHLFVPMLHRRDAVGEHTRTLRDLLVADGVDCRIYTEMPDPDTVDETRPYLEYEDDADPGDVLVYQMATRSDMAGWLADRPEPVVRQLPQHHPAGVLRPVEQLDRPAPGGGHARARASWRRRAALGIGVSEFDADELRAGGLRRRGRDPGGQRAAPARRRRTRRPSPPCRRRAAGRTAVAVGRSPGPQQGPPGHHRRPVRGPGHDVARRPADHRRARRPSPPTPRALRRYAADLGLAGAVEFVSRLSDGELAARYATADVLVMLSEHEGFGVPLVEAMSHGLPVVAYAAGAVPEVVGRRRRPARRARAPAGWPTRWPPCWPTRPAGSALVAAGRARLAALGLDRAGSDLVAALRGVAGRASGGCPAARTGRPRASGGTPEPLGSSLMDSPLHTPPFTLLRRHRRHPGDEVGRRRRARAPTSSSAC